MTKDTLELLHKRLAEVLLERIQEEDCPPGVISAAVKFLKDNEINSLPQEGDNLFKLDDKIRERIMEKMNNAGTA